MSRVVFWAPIWLPLAVVSQFVLLGLKPAQAESRRLDREEAGVLARVDALYRDREHLASNQTRLDDEIWRERVRRSLRNEGAVPLRLDPGPGAPSSASPESASPDSEPPDSEPGGE